jgi:hypothetical protein
MPTRTTATHTTTALAAGASEQSTITLTVGFRLLRIQTSSAARVRLYGSAAHQAADLSRTPGTTPVANAGVLLDYVTTAGLGIATPADLSPVVDGASTEATPSASIPITVTATDAATITVTLTYVATEAP